MAEATWRPIALLAAGLLTIGTVPFAASLAQQDKPAAGKPAKPAGER